MSVDRLGDVPSRRSQVTETLRAAIISGQLEPGTLYSAPELASQLGVSPTPVREAMMHLANEGLIEVARHKGFRVTEPSERDLDEQLELRLLIEVPTVVAVARKGITPAQAATLRTLASATLTTVEAGDFTRHVGADIEFHLTLLELHGNQQLVDMMRVLRYRSRLYGLDAPEKADYLLQAAHEHEELVALLEGRDTASVKRLLRAHIAQVRGEWKRA